jgi:squalene-hopene/tetraprenyl-beta-curcumene cyclase
MKIFCLSRQLACLLLISAVLLTSILHAETICDSSLDNVIADSSKQLYSQIKIRPDGAQYFNMPSYFGRHYISQYYLALQWLQRPDPNFDVEYFVNILKQEQLADGSWYAVKDPAINHGDVSATILNYAFLKAVGINSNSPEMLKAANFVRDNGGLEKSSFFIKIFLALFGNYTWEEVPKIPSLFFSPYTIVGRNNFSAWVSDAIIPVAYFRQLSVYKNLGPNFDLSELFSQQLKQKIAAEHKSNKTKLSDRKKHEKLINLILEVQKPAGNWGLAIGSTLLSAMAVDDYSKYDVNNKTLATSIHRALARSSTIAINNDSGSYQGTGQDGQYWDTALSVQALHESAKYNESDLNSLRKYLVASQHINGGFGFGLEFIDTPDTDDTAETILALKTTSNEHSATIKRAVHWLEEMQNDDGGWAAFSKNKQGGSILRTIVSWKSKPESMFDESSADITGHVLEAFASVGLNKNNSKVVRKAIAYLKETQNPKTATWSGRWGVNTLYGTSAAIVGLLKVGESSNASYIKSAVASLITKQNSDGGFGESTLSYLNSDFEGVGISTPTQTAWVLLVLNMFENSTDLKVNETAAKAANYLINEYQHKNDWVDASPVGTGIPGLEYMIYPVYPKVFPIMALARYRLLCN